jgi:Cys-tRNA(Pro)/Cys-tRNA(Cys) deacylase
MKKDTKTNAARLLDKAGVRYELLPYAVDEDDLSAAHVAAQLGVEEKTVFKTLVLRSCQK